MLSSTLIFAALLSSLPPPGPASSTEQWTTRAEVFRGELDATRRALKKRDPSGLARIYRLWNTAALTDQKPQLKDQLEALTKIKGLDPLVRDHLQYMALDFAHQAGNLQSVSSHTEGLGLANDGWIIGPFENAGNSGHAQSYPPESSFDPKTEIPAKTHPVRWQRIKGLAPHGEIMLAHMVTPNREATAYALFGLKAQKTEKAALRIGAGGQVKVFYDGHLVYEFDGARGPDLDQISIPLLITKGAHRVLIKTSWGRPNAKVLARVTRPKGGALSTVRLDGDPKVILESFKKVQPTPKSAHTIVRVEDRINQAVPKSRGVKKAELLALRSDLFTLLNLFDRRRLPSPARLDLEEAIRINPNHPLYRFYFALRVQSQDPALARQQLEAALTSDPNHIPSLMRLADFARFAGKKAKERQRLKDILKRDKDLRQVHLRIARMGFANPFEKASTYHELEEFCKRKASASCLQQLSVMAIDLNRISLAREYGKQSLDLDQTQHRLRARLARLAYRQGDQLEVDRLCTQGIELWPFRSNNYVQYIEYLRGRENFSKAQDLLAQARERFPDSLALLRLATEDALRRSEKQAAITLLKTALKIDPSLVNVRRQYDLLRGEKNDVQEIVDDDADKIAAQAVSASEKTHGAVYLSDKQVIQLYESGQMTRVHQYTLRLHNPELDRALNTQRIYFTPGRERIEILSAERITPEGSVIRADRVTESGPRGKVGGTYIDQRWKLIQFKKVNAGDTIHIRYRVDSVGPNMFGGFFGDIAYVQARFPKKKVTRIIQAPLSRPLYSDQLRAPPPTKTTNKEQQRVAWELSDLAPIEAEPVAPPYVDRGVVLSVSTYKDWDSLGKWYASLIGEQFELDNDARKAGKDVLKGVTDPQEKIEKLYSYVVKNTRYVGIELGIHGWKPFRASETHRRRYGDCKDKATLLAALLNDNGIEATIALVRTSDRGHLPEDHASMWAFNHAITYVPSANLFLDGTAEFSGTTELPYMDQDGQALIVWPNGTTEKRRIPLQPASKNLQRSRYKAIIGNTGQLTLEAEEELTGAFAHSTRKDYEAKDKRDFKLESKLGRYLPGAKIIKAEFGALDNLEQAPRLSYTAQLEKFGTLNQNNVSIPANLFEVKLRPILASLPKRTEGLFFGYPWSTDEDVHFILPPGASISELPKAKSVINPHIQMTQTYERTKTGLRVKTRISLTSKRIPSEDYQAFRNACGKIDIALSERFKVSL